jgi:DNA-binding IclR family transcriptional regulator
LGLSKASTYRVLHSLRKCQWVVCEPDTGMYRIGYRIMELGLTLLSNTTIEVVSKPYLTELRNITGETVGLSILVGNESMFIEETQSTRDLRYITPMGKKIPLWFGSIGKVILASMNDDQLAVLWDELVRSGESCFPSGKEFDIDKLRTELVTIKKQGYAVSIEEREPGASAVAAVNIVGPSERLNKDILKKYGTLVRETAENITRQMGAYISHQ